MARRRTKREDWYSSECEGDYEVVMEGGRKGEWARQTQVARFMRRVMAFSLLGVLLSSEHDVGHDNAVHLDSGCSTVVRS